MGMKDSGIEWIGEIPEKWKLEQGKYLYKIDTGKLDANAEDDDGKYPFFTCSMYPKKINTFAFDCEALLVAGNGIVGFTQYYNGKFNAYQRTYVLSNFNKINPLFLKYYVANIFPKEANFNSVGSVIDFIKYGDLANFKICIPPIKEQKLIADFLEDKVGKIDDILTDLNKQVEILEKYKKSFITEIVTKGLNPNVMMKDSGIDWIGEIPKDWEVKKIKYTSLLTRGVFGHRPRNDPEYYDGSYPFIQTGDVANANKYILEYSQTLSDLGKQVSREFKKGTIAFTLAANVGDAAILAFDSYFPDSVMAIEPIDNINTTYIYYILSIMKEQFLKVAIISTQLNLNVERVGEIKIPITYNLKEQQEIVDFLDKKCGQIDELIKDKKTQIEKMEGYKKSLIYEYVTGKKRVKGVE